MPISAKPSRCYDLNNSGADAAGVGATLTVSGYGPGLVGLGTDKSAISTTANNGLNFTTDFSINHFLTFGAGAPNNDDFLSILTLADGSRKVELTIYSNPDGTYRIGLESSAFTADGPVSDVVSISAGTHSFSAVRSGSTVQLYLDGVATGSAASLTTSGSAFNHIDWTLFAYTGPGLQLSLYNGAWSSGDLVYLTNSGTPIAYASMSTGGGAGAPCVRLGLGIGIGL